VSVRAESIAATGFYGLFWAPPPGTPRHPGVLEFGGSEGSVSATGRLIGAALASAGYPTLDIAYFGEPGLPATLRDIPLEYFARALRWMARQPQVLKGQVYVMGASRGSEAALLLGAHYPALVHGVIANSPSDVSHGSYPRPGSAAWTFHGNPVPYTSAIVSPSVPADDPAAAIPVQDIRGPVFLDCGTDDQVWASCAYALRIESHLTAARFAYPHVLYRYLGAGHYVNLLVPYQPGEILPNLADPIGSGKTLLASANAHARHGRNCSASWHIPQDRRAWSPRCRPRHHSRLATRPVELAVAPNAPRLAAGRAAAVGSKRPRVGAQRRRFRLLR
jgi:dienelactone hydrolase